MTDVHDPFSPEADPGRDEQELRPARRTVLLTLALAAATASCTSLIPACPTQPVAGTCSHRFCRYHRGAGTGPAPRT